MGILVAGHLLLAPEEHGLSACQVEQQGASSSRACSSRLSRERKLSFICKEWPPAALKWGTLLAAGSASLRLLPGLEASHGGKQGGRLERASTGKKLACRR